MGWERNKPAIAPEPDEPSLVFWLMAGVVALLFGVLLFVLHASKLLGELQQFDPWVVSASLPVAWFLAFCLRDCLYGIALKRHQFESDEAEYAQQQWVEWAGRYLAVLHSSVILPDSLTPALFIKASADLEQHSKQTRRIDSGETEGLEMLLADASDALQQLPADLPLNVMLLTDSPRDVSSVLADFTAVWQRLMPESVKVPDVKVLHEQSLMALEARLKLPDVSAGLILVEQLNGGDRYSDALAVLLLTTDDVTSQYRFEHHARLLRPMALDSERQHEDLAMYFSTQTQANRTQLIIGDTVTRTCSLAALLSAGKETGGQWEPEQLYWLDKYTGVSGPFSPWLVAAVASQVVSLRKADCLMLSCDRQQRFINTVTQGQQG